MRVAGDVAGLAVGAPGDGLCGQAALPAPVGECFHPEVGGHVVGLADVAQEGGARGVRQERLQGPVAEQPVEDRGPRDLG